MTDSLRLQGATLGTDSVAIDFNGHAIRGRPGESDTCVSPFVSPETAFREMSD